MLKINGKCFMNIQEAVQWLLDNNALPYQSTANYVANTEIAKSTLVDPSPANIRVGSLVFFADSKVSTVIGVTANGFIMSDQYNNLVDDIAYVTGVSINGSGHLITTLSDGQTIDAGQIKQVSGFSINASQHLIVSFNDGTSTDLGAIFNGNVNIAGNFTADSIIENMVGYSFNKNTETVNYEITYSYAAPIKAGNKITFVVAGTVVNKTNYTGQVSLGVFNIPSEVGSKLIPYSLSPFNNVLASTKLSFWEDYSLTNCKENPCHMRKSSDSIIYPIAYIETLTQNVTYEFRYEITFGLSDSLAS